jgi:hypothetical protein
MEASRQYVVVSDAVFTIAAGIKISLSSAFPSQTFEKFQVLVTFLSVLRPGEGGSSRSW